MSLGSVPPGEQRSRFLAVGMADQTVRIISLDPQASYECVLACKTSHLVVLGYSAATEYAGFACCSRKPLHC